MSNPEENEPFRETYGRGDEVETGGFFKKFKPTTHAMEIEGAFRVSL